MLQPHGLRLEGRFADDANAARGRLEALAPAAIVVAAYSLILPPWLLGLPRLGCLNVHASLLPRWRGAAPIARAIEAGDAVSGITIMQMDAGLDTGPMLLASSVDIAPDDSAASLHDRLAPLGGRLVVEALGLAARGGLHPQPQPADGASYARKLDKREAPIDWREPAAVIERRMRAFDPFPGASLEVAGLAVKCWRAEVVQDAAGYPGEVLSIDASGPVVACGVAALRLVEMQRPGGRRLPARQAMPGLVPGQRLGD